MNPIHQCNKRYRPETIFHTEIKGHNSDNNWWILSLIELDLYFMIIYLCMKCESNTPMYSKDIDREPFFIHTGWDACTDKGDAICPHIKNGECIKKLPTVCRQYGQSPNFNIYIYKHLPRKG